MMSIRRTNKLMNIRNVYRHVYTEIHLKVEYLWGQEKGLVILVLILVLVLTTRFSSATLPNLKNVAHNFEYYRNREQTSDCS